MFGRATIRLGIGPHSSLTSFFPIVDTCLSSEDIARQSFAMTRSANFGRLLLSDVSAVTKPKPENC